MTTDRSHDRRDAGSAETGRATAATRVYDQLKGEIVRLDVLPGERLVELELCERLGVSRTPVREALRRLEHDGMVVSRERGGRFVRLIDMAAYEGVYAVRRALEGHAVRTACAIASDVELDALAAEWRADVDPTTVPLDGSYVSADERFHLGVAATTGNRYLVESLERINDQLRMVRSVDFTDRERIVVSHDQHQAVIAAMHARDVDGAGALLDDHIAQSVTEIQAIAHRIVDRMYGQPGSRLPTGTGDRRRTRR